MNLEITQVPHGHIAEVYPVIVPYIAKAAEWTLGRMNADDISASLFNPNTQVWVVFDEERRVHGYLATEIRMYPRAKHFCVLNCGGEEGSLEACVHTVFDTFEAFARDTGCDGMEIQGRPGWSKYVKAHDFDQPYRHYFKSLKE